MRTRGLLLVSLSLVYWAVHRLFELLVLCGRDQRTKEIEILVLRHELHVLRRQVARPRLTHRPHGSLDQRAPLPKAVPVSACDHECRVCRRDRLGGLLHEYQRAA